MQTSSVIVRGIELGKQIPKICVPIVAERKEDILAQARKIVTSKPDCIEFRADWYEEVTDQYKILDLLKELRKIVGNTVLLFTFRTTREGGRKTISPEGYMELCRYVCQSGYVDLLDVEAYMEEGLLAQMCEIAHENHVYVVASNHDFEKTPSENEIVRRLQYMEHEGADIPKIAVMPENERDVLTLLSATLKYRELGGERPIITMSMREYGIISRLMGEVFGSALTFGTVGNASAPGQIPVDDVKQVLEVIHKYI